jgi:hypothetical protein
LSNNPIVETLQFNAKTDSENFEMLHAKQMAVILRNRKKKWTKYVKFGGSYNPACRAQIMWEVNAMQFNGHWNKTDKSPNASSDENPIKNYLDNIMKAVGTEYSEPFPWGSIIVKISWWERISMRFAQLLWF